MLPHVATILNDVKSLPEVAAPRMPKAVDSSAMLKKAPIDVLISRFIAINLAAYSQFRFLILALVATSEDEYTRQLGPAFANWTTNDLGKLTPAELRNMLSTKPGNGKAPIVGSYFYGYNFNEVAIAEFGKVFPKGRPFSLKNAKDIVFQRLEDPKMDKNISALIAQQWGRTETFCAPEIFQHVQDVYSAVIVCTPDTAGAGNDTSSISVSFALHQNISPTFYTKTVTSDSYSPYLAATSLQSQLYVSPEYTQHLYDPRRAASDSLGIQAKHGKARARVNAEGFALHVSGMPIALPAEANYVNEFIKIADSALDADGYFIPTALVDKKMDNKILYIDWLNDILAYTTSTGRIEILSLIGTSMLTPDVAYTVFEVPINIKRWMPHFRTLCNAASDIDSSTALRFVDAQWRDKVPMLDVVSIFFKNLISYSGQAKDTTLTINNMCGYDIEGLPDHIQGSIQMFRGYMRALNDKRKTQPDVIPINTNKGLKERIIGLDYLLHATSNRIPADYKLMREDWAREMAKGKVEALDTLAIPNVKIGGTGLNGLLPHQAKGLSSAIKSPRRLVGPIATGGGKTIFTVVTSIFGIKNALDRKETNYRALITTKGNLVKGTITEINSISQGGINAVAFRPVTLRRMRKYGVKTFADLQRWVNSLPPNTIFINSYNDFASSKKIYEELPSIPAFLNKEVNDSQYQRIIRLLNFKQIIADESHMIKNATSQRSMGTYAAMGNADMRGIVSGSFIANTVKDMVGQSVAVSPAIFGADEEGFCEEYGIPRGIIRDDEVATLIKKRLKETTAYLPANKNEWSYMLPAKKDSVQMATMTEKQDIFYNKIMMEAYASYVASTQTKKKAEKVEGDEDDEDEDEDEDEGDDEDDMEEEKLIAAIKIFLTNVEQFLAAPDESIAYMNPTEGAPPSGADAISPKVPLADRIITQHLAKYKGDAAKNKVIVFGINHSAIRHFVKHSKYGKDALVYWAGDEETLRKFKTDPTKLVMIAAETSIREGENLQMTSLIVKLQAPWTPGDYEQSMARMYRPDPRGVYARDEVEHVLLCAETSKGDPTLDGCKTARLISKFISNGRFLYEDRMDWKRESIKYEDLGLLRMTLDFIFQTKNEDLLKYFGSWSSFVEYENKINKLDRIEAAKTLEASTKEKLIDEKGNIIDVAKFIRMSMTEVTAAPPLPGSRSVFTPWMAGALPPDPDGYGFAVLGAQNVREGVAVLTELGPGIVRKVFSARTLKVEVYGNKIRGFTRQQLMVPNEKNRARFESIMKDGKKWQAASQDPFDATKKMSTTVRGGGAVEEVLIEKPKAPSNTPILDESDKPAVDVNTAVLNGFPALIIDGSDEELETLTKIGWNYVDPYVSVVFNNWNALVTFLNDLEDRTYISEKNFEKITSEIEEFRTGRAVKLTRQVNPKNVRQFFQDARKRFGDKDGKPVCVPYLIAVDDEVRLAFDINSHDKRIIKWIKDNGIKRKGGQGVKSVKQNSGLWARIFSNMAEARKHLSDMVGVVDFDQADLSRELTALGEEIKDLMAARRRPSA